MKIIVPFKAIDNDFLIRIDINEIAAYMPDALTNGKDSKEGTTIVLKSGETLVISECTDKLDEMFKNKNILQNLN